MGAIDSLHKVTPIGVVFRKKFRSKIHVKSLITFREHSNVILLFFREEDFQSNGPPMSKMQRENAKNQ
jgi:hypothetical protein